MGVMSKKIEQRKGGKNLGSILGGADMNNDGYIMRGAFYNIIDAQGFGMGEGDIQEIL